MGKRGGWPPSGFGGRLKAIREALGVSQAELAERVGAHVFTVSKLERGLHEPAWPLALALADALGVSVELFRVGKRAGRPKKGGAQDHG
jgi:transcriptional regulator with XRE-family HTH domain